MGLKKIVQTGKMRLLLGLSLALLLASCGDQQNEATQNSQVVLDHEIATKGLASIPTYTSVNPIFTVHGATSLPGYYIQAYPIPYTITVDLPASADNTLYQISTGTPLSNGGGTQMISGRTNQASNSVRRAVVAFDIASALTPTAVVLDAQLFLTLEATSNTTVDNLTLQTVNASWGEGTTVATNQGQGATAASGDVTWLHRFLSTPFWTTPGGDFNPVVSASTTVSTPGTYVWHSTAMAADVQSWRNTPANNHGWVILGNETIAATTKKFFTRESTVTPPVLRVRYRP
jgi:hypothetical protein